MAVSWMTRGLLSSINCVTSRAGGGGWVATSDISAQDQLVSPALWDGPSMMSWSRCGRQRAVTARQINYPSTQ